MQGLVSRSPQLDLPCREEMYYPLRSNPMKRRTGSTSTVSTRIAQRRLPLLDPASVEEVAHEIPVARQCGGGYGGGSSRTGLRQAMHTREEGEGAARVTWGASPCTSTPPHICEGLCGAPQSHLGPAKGGNLPPPRGPT